MNIRVWFERTPLFIIDAILTENFMSWDSFLYYSFTFICMLHFKDYECSGFFQCGNTYEDGQLESTRSLLGRKLERWFKFIRHEWTKGEGWGRVRWYVSWRSGILQYVLHCQVLKSYILQKIWNNLFFLHFQIIICTWQCYVNDFLITAYDNGAKSKFSWDFMYQAFDPKTQYQIKRPQAEIRPHPLFVSIHKFMSMNFQFE